MRISCFVECNSNEGWKSHYLKYECYFAWMSRGNFVKNLNCCYQKTILIVYCRNILLLSLSVWLTRESCDITPVLSFLFCFVNDQNLFMSEWGCFFPLVYVWRLIPCNFNVFFYEIFNLDFLSSLMTHFNRMIEFWNATSLFLHIRSLLLINDKHIVYYKSTEEKNDVPIYILIYFGSFTWNLLLILPT